MNSSQDLEARLRRAARFFYALKDPVRLRILVALAQTGEMTVTELVRAVRLAQPLISWHLARLRAVGLVQVRRDGRLARYALHRETLLQQYADFLALLNPKPSEEV
ncbi:MAG: metalloregulator ArsR/SmtB family transcription factor [Anaerolineae bacterium]|nr:metalloregulator ArsR/SmtB family transcription factor [Anaerolineae bacterium]MCX8066413.1 metalloregulator ArsR/SmtB family transcription factor [Anaerolineae bacterium]MDW7991361.1 metalloregulator ArsR/SmtB family transcription factor [Anaerolineae bacterium]